MAGWGTWIALMVGPLVNRVLIALNITIVTLVGLNSIKEQIKTSIMSGWSSVPDAALRLIEMAGLFDIFGIGLGLMAFGVTLLGTTRLLRILAPT